MPSLLRLSRPIHLLLTALTYALGAGLADYLGESHLPDSFWLGLTGVLLAQASMGLLGEAFRPANEPILKGESPSARQALRNNCLYLAIASLSIFIVIAWLLFVTHRLTLLGLVFVGLSVLTVLIYAAPPIRLLNRGFGEFLSAIHLAYIIPSIAFVLQAQDYHRLVGLTTVPLTVIALAYFLVMDFPAFADDQKYERCTLLTLLGWQRAIPFHHWLIITAYSLFAFTILLGVSHGFLWPVLIPLPFAILQARFLRNIGLGLQPNWTLLTANALAVFGLTAYFLALTFFIR
jgi:1,4-dihydroxy-2-naphthoate octaprenyltransferase